MNLQFPKFYLLTPVLSFFSHFHVNIIYIYNNYYTAKSIYFQVKNKKAGNQKPKGSWLKPAIIYVLQNTFFFT